MKVSSLSPKLLRQKQGWSAAWLYRTFGGIGKDVVHHAGVLGAMIVASIVALYAPWVIAVLQGEQASGLVSSKAPATYFAMIVGTAYLIGLVLSSEESENSMHSLLDVLPARMLRHFLYKLAAGAILILTFTIAAGLLMGLLSGHGWGLLTGLVIEPPKMIIVGGTWFHLFLQIASIFLTGLVMGAATTMFASGALLGAVLYLAFMSSYFLSANNNEFIQTPLLDVIVLVAWIALGYVLYGPAVRYNRTRNRSTGAEAESVATDVSKGMYLHLAGLKFDPPNRHVIRVPALWAILASAILSGLPIMWNPGMLLAPFYPITLGLLGACAWKQNERHTTRFLTYALPVPRNRVFWPRMIALVMASTVVGVAALFFLLVTFYLTLSEEGRATFAAYALNPMMLLLVLGAPVTALLGAMFRLFFRSMIICSILACVVLMVWVPVAVVGLHQLVKWSGEPFGSHSIIHVIWCFTVCIGLPLLCSWIAMCRTRLLELPDAQRGRIAIALMLLLIVWGGFMLATPPTHLYQIIFG